MGWEARGPNGHRYYYRKARRSDGTVRSAYAGSGPAAVAAAEVDAFVRADRAWRRAAEGVVLGDVDAADAACRALTAAVGAELAAALEAEGYRYHRGEWRRPRGARRREATEGPATDGPATDGGAPAPDDDRSRGGTEAPAGGTS